MDRLKSTTIKELVENLHLAALSGAEATLGKEAVTALAAHIGAMEAELATLRDQIKRAEEQEPVAYGLPNTSISMAKHSLMQVALDVPTDDQYAGALWLPLVFKHDNGGAYLREAAQPEQTENVGGVWVDGKWQELSQSRSAKPEQITPKQLAKMVADNPVLHFSVKSSPADEELRRERVRQALSDAGFRLQDDYYLANGASLMSEDSHQIIHRDVVDEIVRAALAAEKREGS